MEVITTTTKSGFFNVPFIWKNVSEFIPDLIESADASIANTKIQKSEIA